MQPSNDILGFLKLQESFKDKAYKPLPDDKWTIGFGFTHMLDKPIKEGDVITYQDASQCLMFLAVNVAKQINAAGIPNIPQRQFDAVLSLVYNIGIGNFTPSTTAKMYYAGQNISERFVKWNLFQGKPCQGLTNRRIREKNVYDNGIYG